MTNEERHRLDEQGFVVLETCMGSDLLHELREQIHEVFDMEGDRAGMEFRTEAHAHRLANLVDKGEVFRRAIMTPRGAGSNPGNCSAPNLDFLQCSSGRRSSIQATRRWDM